MPSDLLNKMLRCTYGTKGYTDFDEYTRAVFLGKFVLVPFSTIYGYYFKDEPTPSSYLKPIDFSRWIGNDENRKSFFDDKFRKIHKDDTYRDAYYALWEECQHHYLLNTTSWWYLEEEVAFFKRLYVAFLTALIVDKRQIPKVLNLQILKISTLQHAIIDILSPFIEGSLHWSNTSSKDDKESNKKHYGPKVQNMVDFLSSKLKGNGFSEEMDCRNFLFMYIKDFLNENNPTYELVKATEPKHIWFAAQKIQNNMIESFYKAFESIPKYYHNTIEDTKYVPKRRYNTRLWLSLSLINISFLRLLFKYFILSKEFQSWAMRYGSFLLYKFTFKTKNLAENRLYLHPAIRMYSIDGTHLSYDHLVASVETKEIGIVGFESRIKVKNRNNFNTMLPLIYFYISLVTSVISSKQSRLRNPKEDLYFACQVNPAIKNDFGFIYNWLLRELNAIDYYCRDYFKNSNTDLLLRKIIKRAERIHNISNNLPYSNSLKMYLETQFIHGG